MLLLSTDTVTVQLLLAFTVMPEKLSVVAAAVNEFDAAPVQVPPAAAVAAICMLLRVSVKATPVNAEALELVSVNVTVDAPPRMTVPGLKLFEMVGDE